MNSVDNRIISCHWKKK